MKPSLGYVGIGLMGLPMVRHLCGSGYRIRCCDIVKDKIDAALSAGAIAAHSPADAARDTDLVVLNLPTTDAVETAVFGADGVAGAMRKPQVLVDFSTIKVAKGKSFAARLKKETGCGWVDAPVSGGPPASGSGTLTVMAGGDSDDIAAASILLKDVAARFTHMGPAGSGLAAKMINQLIVGCGHAVMAEAVVLAESAGIDAKRIPECLAGGHADGTLLQKLYPRMAERDFKPQGFARQLLKDLEMVLEFSAELKAPVPMTGEALGLYRILVRRGHAELDTSAILKINESDK
jgi:3-hydroxyisobutyrate dehydrogenase-like beta-hydroxyacid dehydrogenase